MARKIVNFVLNRHEDSNSSACIYVRSSLMAKVSRCDREDASSILVSWPLWSDGPNGKDDRLQSYKFEFESRSDLSISAGVSIAFDISNVEGSVWFWGGEFCSYGIMVLHHLATVKMKVRFFLSTFSRQIIFEEYKIWAKRAKLLKDIEDICYSK